MSGHFQLAGQIAERGFERYAEILATQDPSERQELADRILDSALDEAEVANFRDGWFYDETLRTWLQPA